MILLICSSLVNCTERWLEGGAAAIQHRKKKHYETSIDLFGNIIYRIAGLIC